MNECTDEDHEDAWQQGRDSQPDNVRAMNYPPEYPEDLKDDYIFGYFNYKGDDND